MQCPKCNSAIHPSEARCPHCGADRPPRRVIFGGERAEFRLTPEEDSFELGDPAETKDWPFVQRRALEPDQPFTPILQTPQQQKRWGGFLRRSSALLIDAVVLAVLATIMGLLSHIAYKVGLAAHGRPVTWQNAMPLTVMLNWGWIGLVTGYFVLFHGMGGKTIGKWMLGLRVVGAEERSVTYKQAFLRWVGTVGFAPLVLGFLWVIWSREKRGWHDFLARTWVIRD
jgi:uncharacterized RDD family membrane protein YckC